MRNCGIGIAALCAAFVSTSVSAVGAPIDLVNWDFIASESWVDNSVQSLKDAGWTVNTAADSDTAFFVDTGFSNPTMTGVVWLKDLVTDGQAEALLNFGSVEDGSANIRAALEGSQSQTTEIVLLSGTTALAKIVLTNNTTASFVSGAGTTPLAPTGGTFFRTGHDFNLDWTVNPDGTGGLVSLTYEGSGVALNEAFLANGVPDTIRLKAGFGSGVNRVLLVDSLKITNNVPEPTSAAGLGLVGAGLILARKRY